MLLCTCGLKPVAWCIIKIGFKTKYRMEEGQYVFEILEVAIMNRNPFKRVRLIRSDIQFYYGLWGIVVLVHVP